MQAESHPVNAERAHGTVPRRAATLTRCIRRALRWLELRRQLRHAMELDDRLLRDVGLCRAQLRHSDLRPILDAIEGRDA